MPSDTPPKPSSSTNLLINPKYTNNQDSDPYEHLVPAHNNEATEDKSSSSSTDMPKLEELINRIGFTFYHFILLLNICLIFFHTGIQIFSINIIIQNLKLKIEMTNLYVLLIGASYFVGELIGSITSSFISKKFGRVTPLIICMMLSFIFTNIVTVLYDLTPLIIFRVLNGICTGQAIVMAKTSVGESVPSFIRPLILALPYAAYRVGVISFILTEHFMKEASFSPDSWRYSLLINSISILLSIIISLVYLEESPRLQIYMNKIDDLVNYLKRQAEGKRIHIHEDEFQQLREQANFTSQQHHIMPYTTLLKKPFLGIYSASLALGFLISFINIANMFVLPLVFMNATHNTDSIWVDMTLQQFFTVFAIFFAVLLATKTFLGRRFSIYGGLVLTAITALIGAALGGNLKVMSIIMTASSIIAYVVFKIYMIELYPTSVRDMAFSTVYVASKVGDSLAHFMLNSVYALSIVAPVYLIGVISLLASFLIFVLTIETRDKPLDFKH